MEPQIPDASLCAFRSKIPCSWDGKVLLIEQYAEQAGTDILSSCVIFSRVSIRTMGAMKLGCTRALPSNQSTLPISLGMFRLPEKSEPWESSSSLSVSVRQQACSFALKRRWERAGRKTSCSIARAQLTNRTCSQPIDSRR